MIVTPYPFGRASVPFTLTEHDAKARKAVFENPSHDFPKRIVYHRKSDDALWISVAGDHPGPG